MNESLIVTETNELERLEDTISKNMKAFYLVGSALIEIRDKGLYRDTHETFEDYCKERWDMGRNYAYKLIASSETVTNLENVYNRTQIPTTEFQIRPLTKLSPELQIEAWQKAIDTAPDGRITARHVNSVVIDITGEEPKVVEEPKPYRYALEYARMAVESMKRIQESDPDYMLALSRCKRWIDNKLKEVNEGND